MMVVGGKDYDLYLYPVIIYNLTPHSMGGGGRGGIIIITNIITTSPILYFIIELYLCRNRIMMMGGGLQLVHIHCYDV